MANSDGRLTTTKSTGDICTAKSASLEIQMENSGSSEFRKVVV